jgi:hypothetical protein
MARAIEIAEAKNNFKQPKDLREELFKIHDMGFGVSVNMQK